MKTIKWLLKFFLVSFILLILVLGIGIFILVKWVDPNQFKPEIITLVHQQTGRDLKFKGDLAWSFYPRLGIHLPEASLSNPPSFSQPLFAKIDSADLDLDTLALFQGHIAVNTLSVKGLHVFLLQQGKVNNWTFSPLLPSSPPAGPITHNSAPAKEVRGSQALAGAAVLSMMIETLSIQDAAFDYDNDQEAKHDRFSQVNIKMSGIALNRAFPINISASFNLPHLFSGDLKAYVLAKYSMHDQVLSLSNMAIQVEGLYGSPKPMPINVKLSGALDFNSNTQVLHLNPLHFVMNQSMQGEVKALIQGLGNRMHYQGSISLPIFSLSDFMSSLHWTAPVFANPKILSQVSFAGQFQGDLNHVALSNINANLGPSHIQGALQFPSFIPLSMSEALEVDRLDLADYFALKGARLLLSSIQAKGTFSISNQNASQSLNIQSVILKGYSLESVLSRINQVIAGVSAKGGVQNLAQLIPTLQALQKEVTLNPDAETNLGVLKAQINMIHGVIRTPVMTLAGPSFQSSGSGIVDLNQKNIHYTFTNKVISQNLPNLSGLSIPVVIQGPFATYSVSLDWDLINKQVLSRLTSQAKVGVKALISSHSDDLKKQAAEALKGLFSGK